MASAQPKDGPAPSRVELVTQQPMVNWLGPTQLINTGVQALLAQAVGSFADGRQMQAALCPTGKNQPGDFSAADADGGIWLDYVADTGDGWDSTYSVAYSVSREYQGIEVDREAIKLPRGRVLILGGDQIYPTPSHSGYRTRFLDPFRSAFPSAVVGRDPPDDPTIYALPGNHDWYDGLQGFVQLFCSGLHIGRWKTAQATSYFAFKLPHGWWAWGVDLRLESVMDAQQRHWFTEVAAQALKPGDQVIVCAPDCSWIDESERLRRAETASLSEIETQSLRFHALRDMEELIVSKGAHVGLVLSGDQHCYARWQPAAGADPSTPLRLTCGGGGAYMLGTHDMPQELKFKSNKVDQIYKRERSYPSDTESRSLRDKGWRLPWRNPSFCGLLAGIYLLLIWVLQGASKVPEEALNGLSLVAYLAQLPFERAGDLPAAIYALLRHSPGASVLTAGIVASASVFTATKIKEGKRRAYVGGGLHGLSHIALALLMLWGLAHWDIAAGLSAQFPGLGPDLPDSWLGELLFALELGALSFFCGGILFGAWMVVANRLYGWHDEEVFSAQGIADYRSFLRMRIDADGLTIFPLKIEKACRKWRLGYGVEQLKQVGRTWRLRANADSGARFEPAEPLKVELIEDPLFVPKA